MPPWVGATCARHRTGARRAGFCPNQCRRGSGSGRLWRHSLPTTAVGDPGALGPGRQGRAYVREMKFPQQSGGGGVGGACRWSQEINAVRFLEGRAAAHDLSLASTSCKFSVSAGAAVAAGRPANDLRVATPSCSSICGAWALKSSNRAAGLCDDLMAEPHPYQSATSRLPRLSRGFAVAKPRPA